MKKIVLTLFVFFSFSQLFATDLQIDINDTVMVGEPGQSFIFEGYVHNLSANVMVVQMTRTVNDIPENWTTTLCFGVNCYPPHVSAPDPVAINPGDSLFFDVTFNSDSIPNSGQVIIRFEDLVSGQKDSVLLSVTTKINPTFQFQFQDTLAIASPGKSFAFETYVHNLTDSALVLKVIRVENNIPDDWSTTLCLGISCYPPGVSEVTDVIMPGDSAFFDIVFNTSENPASGHVRLEFVDLLTGQSSQQNLFLKTELPAKVIEVMFKDTAATGNPGQELVGEGKIYNISDSTQKVVIVRKTNHLPEGWSSSLCFDICYKPEVDTISTELNKGDSLEFSIHFFTNDQPAKGWATLLIFAEGSQDTIEQTVYAETQATALTEFNTLKLKRFTILGNYPNPFNATTTIEFFTPVPLGELIFQVFSITGKRIVTKKISNVKSGVNHIRFNANDLASGLYFYQLIAPSATGKMSQSKGKFLLIK